VPRPSSARRWFTEPWRTTHAGRDIAVGLTIGMGTPTLILIALWSGGWQSVAWHGEPPLDVLTTFATGAVLGPILEELVFRYLALRGLELVTGPVTATSITATLFGLLHLISPHATPQGGAAATTAGLMFGAAYLATRTMWLPTALHVGWNLISVVLVGPPDPSAHRLFFVTPHGSILISGGGFGPDASLLTIVACLLLAGRFLTVAGRAAATHPATPGRGGVVEQAHAVDLANWPLERAPTDQLTTEWTADDRRGRPQRTALF
jgi:membrane protease YdiL (CAAX protease family)